MHPNWFTEDALRFFNAKYLYKANDPLEQYQRIAYTLSRHAPGDKDYWAEQFFDMIWRGLLSCSTPCLGNTGTDRGMVVSCYGNYLGDSLDSMLSGRRENGLLTKAGGGTSSYLGQRGRGEPISKGGFASGAAVEFERNRQLSQDISQGGIRRGAWCGYYPVDGKDFYEIWHLVKDNPDDSNIGWCISDEFTQRLEEQNEEAIKRYKHILYLRARLGRGFLFFTDKVNRAKPSFYDLRVNASNLCTETSLGSNEEYSFTCVLMALNLIHWDTLKNEDTIFKATVMTDCLASEYIQQAKGVPGLEKVVHYTEDYRSLGLGVMGLHSLYQMHMLPFNSFGAHMLNNEIFRTISRESRRASEYLASELGEPNKLKGTCLRNSHRTALMPTMSTAIIMGGYSEGISPMVTNVYTKGSAGGELPSVNPVFEKYLKDTNRYSEDLIRALNLNEGSIQGNPLFTESEQKVFASAFEIPQEAIVTQAASRQRYLCQTQSLNLYFSQNESEKYLSKIHMELFRNPNIQTAYYVRSSRKAKARTTDYVCESCQ